MYREVVWRMTEEICMRGYYCYIDEERVERSKMKISGTVFATTSQPFWLIEAVVGRFPSISNSYLTFP